MPTRPFFAALVAAAWCLTGCTGSSDCETACRKMNTCPSGTPTEADCAAVCATSESQAAKAGCTGEHDALVACQVGLPEMCSAVVLTDACAPEMAAYGSCTKAFCEKNPAECGD